MDQRARRYARIIAIGVGVGIIGAQLVGTLLARTAGLVAPIGVALFFSFAMEPAVARLSRRMRRGIATGVVLLSSVMIIGGLIAIGGAVIVAEGGQLLDNLPNIAASVQERLASIGINVDLVSQVNEGGFIEGLRSSISERAKSLSGTALSGLGTLLAMLFMVFYFSADSHRLIRSACSLLPANRQQHVVRAWDLAIEKAGGYLYSRVVLAGVSATVHSIAFLVAGVDYPIPMGLWVGAISQLIPVIGTYLAGALPVVIALGSSPSEAIVVLVTIIVYQQIENLVLAPRVTRNAIDIHPLAGFISILFGASLLGWVGALVAVPICATVVAFTSAFVVRHDVVGIDRSSGGQSSDDQPDSGEETA